MKNRDDVKYVGLPDLALMTEVYRDFNDTDMDTLIDTFRIIDEAGGNSDGAELSAYIGLYDEWDNKMLPNAGNGYGDTVVVMVARIPAHMKEATTPINEAAGEHYAYSLLVDAEQKRARLKEELEQAERDLEAIREARRQVEEGTDY